MIKNKTVLITGGAGFLGSKLTERYLNDNKIVIYSRDEAKHSKSSMYFNNHPNITYILGDVRDVNKVKQTLLRVNPHIVIMAAALKQIDRCEIETHECVSTNIYGTQNVLNEIENNLSLLTNLENVVFVSTDKATSPVNIYGMSKGISEIIVVEKSKYIKNNESFKQKTLINIC